MLKKRPDLAKEFTARAERANQRALKCFDLSTKYERLAHGAQQTLASKTKEDAKMTVETINISKTPPKASSSNISTADVNVYVQRLANLLLPSVQKPQEQDAHSIIKRHQKLLESLPKGLQEKLEAKIHAGTGQLLVSRAELQAKPKQYTTEEWMAYGKIALEIAKSEAKITRDNDALALSQRFQDIKKSNPELLRELVAFSQYCEKTRVNPELEKLGVAFLIGGNAALWKAIEASGIHETRKAQDKFSEARVKIGRFKDSEIYQNSIEQQKSLEHSIRPGTK